MGHSLFLKRGSDVTKLIAIEGCCRMNESHSMGFLEISIVAEPLFEVMETDLDSRL